MKWICRPDTSSIMTPIYDSISPRNLNKEDQPDSQIQETNANSQSKVEALPPAFTSLVSSCAADLEQGIPLFLEMALHVPSTVHDVSFLYITTSMIPVPLSGCTYATLSMY